VPLQQQHPGTLKKPQGPATFWGDAIEIFPLVIFQFSESESCTVAHFTLKLAIQKVEVLGGCNCNSHILGHRKPAGC